jgi:hypothetical protein
LLGKARRENVRAEVCRWIVSRVNFRVRVNAGYRIASRVKNKRLFPWTSPFPRTFPAASHSLFLHEMEEHIFVNRLIQHNSSHCGSIFSRVCHSCPVNRRRWRDGREGGGWETAYDCNINPGW